MLPSVVIKIQLRPREIGIRQNLSTSASNRWAIAAVQGCILVLELQCLSAAAAVQNSIPILKG
jgi:hypothetical protein